MNRADKMLAALLDGEPHSRAELHAAGGFYLTNNAAAELRQRGYNVAQHVRVIDGRRTWWYQLDDSSSPLSEPDRPLTAATNGAVTDAGRPPGFVSGSLRGEQLSIFRQAA